MTAVFVAVAARSSDETQPVAAFAAEASAARDPVRDAPLVASAVVAAVAFPGRAVVGTAEAPLARHLPRWHPST